MKGLNELLKPYKGLRKEIYVIALSRTINAMGALVFPFMTLLLSKKLGLSDIETGFWVTIGGLLFMPSSLIGGKITDYFGRKKVLITFETLGVLGYGVCLFLPLNMSIVYALLISSFLFGLAGPSHDAMMADLTTPEQRQGAYSLGYLGFNLGFAMATIIGGLLFEDYFRWMFVIDVGTALIGILLILLFVKETFNKDQLSVVSAESEHEAAVTGSIFKVLLKRPILLYFAIASFGYKLIYTGWSFVMPLHSEANFPDQGARLYGFLGFTNAVIVVVMTPIITILFHKATNIRRIIYAGVLFTLGFGLLGFISFKIAFFLSVIIFTLGEILEAISSMPYIMNHTPASHRGRMSSVLPMLMGAGYTLGPIVMGNMITYFDYEGTWRIIGGIGIVATVLMIFVSVYDKQKERLALNIKA